jgi:hypothetical protein
MYDDLIDMLMKAKFYYQSAHGEQKTSFSIIDVEISAIISNYLRKNPSVLDSPNKHFRDKHNLPFQPAENK